MPIQLVETSEEDSYVAVAAHIAGFLNEGQNKTALAETPGSRFADDCTNLVAEERYADYAQRIAGQVDLLLAKSTSAKDTEACLNVLCHAVGRVGEESQQAVATSVAQALAKNDDHPEDRIVALLNLYNVTSLPAVQHAMLLIAADFSRRNPRIATLLGGAIKGKADTWVKEWGLPQAQTRELLLALASVLRTCPDRASAKECVKLTAAALELAQPGDAAALATMKPVAVSALNDFLRSPVTFQCDLLEIPAVAQLASDPQYAPLYGLVSSLVAGDFAAVRAKASPEVLAAAGTTPEALAGKARMVALLARCVAAGHEDLPLANLAKAMDVPEEQVQLWVVRAIGAKLMEGKIDQVRGVLSVSGATQPAFGAAQWRELSAKLASLKQHLATVDGLIANVKPPQPLSARMQAQPPIRT